MRGSIKTAALGAAATATAAVASLVVTAPAHAEVWNCQPGINYSGNVGYTTCFAGSGFYRVGATCNRAVYPYSITVYGPWQSRSNGTANPTPSFVFGDSYSCYIATVWTEV
ncbi:MAG: hypothetical protein J2P17_33850 [Mycobacterium sp.]|nr:hypothetical protein [Mycobacterium sp.]